MDDSRPMVLGSTLQLVLGLALADFSETEDSVQSEVMRMKEEPHTFSFDLIIDFRANSRSASISSSSPSSTTTGFWSSFFAVFSSSRRTGAADAGGRDQKPVNIGTFVLEGAGRMAKDDEGVLDSSAKNDCGQGF